MNLYQYGDDFYSYQQIGSLASARTVVPLLLRHLPVRSVLDVGCGAGAWLAAYLEAGVADVSGVDGSYVRPQQLMIEPSQFRAVDVSGPFRLSRTFELVQCLEVAEHLDPGSSATLVDNLAAHGSAVLFSAAPPGQGGEHHVNERPYEFWRGLFAQRGYELYDFVRPVLRDRHEVEPWYRYNTLLFVRREAAGTLHRDIATTWVPPEERVADVSPLLFRGRKRILAMLPVPVVTGMASLKHRLILRRHQRVAIG